jgi:hypothetical protein
MLFFCANLRAGRFTGVCKMMRSRDRHIAGRCGDLCGAQSKANAHLGRRFFLRSPGQVAHGIKGCTHGVA